MLAHELEGLRHFNTPFIKWGSSHRVKVSRRIGKKVYVSDLTKTSNLRLVASEYKINFDRLKQQLSLGFIQNEDKRSLDAINAQSGKTEVALSTFNRIRKDIVAPADKQLLVHFKDDNGIIVKTYHLEDRLINIDNLFIDEENQYSSGADVELNILPSTVIEVEWINNPARSRSQRKNFFRYLTKVDYKLEAYQVYSDYQDFNVEDVSFDPENYVNDVEAKDYPCFLFALLKAGVSAKTVKQISQTMFNSRATVDFIRKTAKAFNLNIIVKQYRLKGEKADFKTTSYGDKSNQHVLLGGVGGHLFAIHPTKITKAAIANPEFVEEYNRTDFAIKRGRPSFNSTKIKFLDSYNVISFLYHHRETHLETITQRNTPLLLNNKYQEVRYLDEEDFNETNFKLLRSDDEMKTGCAPFRKFSTSSKEFEDVQSYNVVYFDLETLVVDSIHKPYCVSFCIGESSTGTFSPTECIYGFNCIERFLDSLPTNSHNLLWAYNAGFDSRFLFKYMTFSSKSTNLIDVGTKLKQAHGFYKGREIVIKDAMSFLSGGLASLPEMFKDASKEISLEKECFPHNLINENNFQSKWPIKYLNSYKDKDTLIANARKIGAISNDMFTSGGVADTRPSAERQLFDCEKYAIHYCNRDVDVLKTCFEAFRSLVKGEFDLDVYRFLSISSLSIAYQYNEGCFDDCYEVNSVLLGFLRQATVGGRVMTRDNGKYHIKHKLADFDAVSLYPSAMSELPGYVKGKCKLFRNAIPSDADWYVARVRIDSIGIKRHFPLQSFYENGSRNFTNDIVGREMILGKQALDDIEQFQLAKYTIIDGAYWNDGFNDQITKTISKMFNARLRYKAEGNPLQNVFKLMMNSSYGKLLMKPIVKKKVFVSGGKDKIDAYTCKNVHKMISRTPITDSLALFEEHKPLKDHFSPIHLGIQILDSSKHIMNRVMCLAEDINANIWYQDTDSMHIDYDAVPTLADAYKEKYNKELIGKQMGQFHVDFNLEGSEGDIFAKESIFLGKKSYLDVLACDGNDVEGFHIRMKGIPSKLLEENTHDTYMKLFNGEPVEFDLSELCSININSKTQNVSKRSKFTRNVSFL